MVLRQRGMRLTILTMLDDLAYRLPQVQRNVMLVRKQFADRFRYEDILMQQITPAGYDATEKVSPKLFYPCNSNLPLLAVGVQPVHVYPNVFLPS